MKEFKKFINQTLKIQGFVNVKTVKIEDVYLLGGNKKYPSFRCVVIDSQLNERIGERENLLAQDVIRDNRLVDTIKVLGR